MGVERRTILIRTITCASIVRELLLCQSATAKIHGLCIGGIFLTVSDSRRAPSVIYNCVPYLLIFILIFYVE